MILGSGDRDFILENLKNGNVSEAVEKIKLFYDPKNEEHSSSLVGLNLFVQKIVLNDPSITFENKKLFWIDYYKILSKDHKLLLASNCLISLQQKYSDQDNTLRVNLLNDAIHSILDKVAKLQYVEQLFEGKSFSSLSVLKHLEISDIFEDLLKSSLEKANLLLIVFLKNNFHDFFEKTRNKWQKKDACKADCDNAQRLNQFFKLEKNDRDYLLESIALFQGVNPGEADLGSRGVQLTMAERRIRKKYDYCPTFLKESLPDGLFLIDQSKTTRAALVLTDFLEKTPALVRVSSEGSFVFPYVLLRLDEFGKVVIEDIQVFFEDEDRVAYGKLQAFFEKQEKTKVNASQCPEDDWMKSIWEKRYIYRKGKMYTEFSDYLKSIKDKLSESPMLFLNEIFAIGGDQEFHQIAGQITIKDGKVNVVLVDSLGLFSNETFHLHATLEHAIREVSNFFPESEIYIESVKRQNTKVGCAVFAAYDLQKLHAFREREGDIFQWLLSQELPENASITPTLTETSIKKKVQEKCGVTNIHLTKLPPEFMLPQQSRKLFTPGFLCLKERGDRSRFVGKSRLKTPQSISDEFETRAGFSDVRSMTTSKNPKMIDKLESYRFHVLDYLLDCLSDRDQGRVKVEKDLQAHSLEAFKTRLGLGMDCSKTATDEGKKHTRP